MSKIDVLAVLVTDSKSDLIKSKSGLTSLINTSPELVKIVPLAPSPGLVAATFAYDLPSGSVFVAHSPTNRKWAAQISRNESHVFTVK